MTVAPAIPCAGPRAISYTRPVSVRSPPRVGVAVGVSVDVAVGVAVAVGGGVKVGVSVGVADAVTWPWAWR